MKTVLILMAMVMCTQSAIADPSPVVQALMDEPASLFDLGMVKMLRSLDRSNASFNEYMKERFPQVQRIAPVRLAYVYDENEFYLTVTVICKTALSSEQKKGIAKGALQFVDNGFNSWDTHEDDVIDNWAGKLLYWFGHAKDFGYGGDLTQWRQLGELFRVEVYIDREMYAERKLFGKRVMFAE